MATPLTYGQMKSILKKEGLKVKSYSGCTSRCRCHSGSHAKGGPKIRAYGGMNGQLNHITAGNLGGRSVDVYIRDIINGSSAVPNKAHLVIDPWGVVHINSLGRANHAGRISSRGFSRVVAGSFSLTKQWDPTRGHDMDGNTHLYGYEVIAAAHMNAAQYEALVRINAAVARWHNWGGRESAGHGELSDQRSYADPGIHMGHFRSAIVRRIGGSPKAGKSSTPAKKAKSAPKVHKSPTNTMNPKSYFIGARGKQVTWLGKQLVSHLKALGIKPPYKVGPGANFTATDKKAVQLFQKAQGWSGADADGFPGPETLRRLAATPAQHKKKAKKKRAERLTDYKPSYFKIGRHGHGVTLLGKALVKHGYKKHYRVGPGPTFSNSDRLNVRDFQWAQGWRGRDADGYPGPETLRRLSK